MNRAEYMKELAYLLQDVADEEREEALQYYEDYFDDAGTENEEQVIAELGRPEKLAAIIREGARTGYENPDAEYTEHGYQNERYRGPQYEIVPPNQVEKKRIGDGNAPDEETEGENGGRDTENRRAAKEDNWKERTRSVCEELAQKISEGIEEGRRRMEESRERRRQEQDEENVRRDGSGDSYSSGVPARRRGCLGGLLAMIGFLFLLPFLIGAAAAAFGFLLAIVCAAGGIALAVIILAVVFLVTGVVIFGIGMGKLFMFPMAGMMFMGIGLILCSLGVFSVWLSVLVFGKMIPGVIRMVGNFFNFIFRRRRGGVLS